MFLQWGDSFALICFSTPAGGSFRWQGDICVWVEQHKVNVDPQERNFAPLGLMLHDLFITPHVCGSGLWAVHMCWYVPCRPSPPDGFALEKVASSYMCGKSGRDGEKKKFKTACMTRVTQKNNNCRRFVETSGREDPLFRNNPFLPNCQINFFCSSG